MEQDIINFFEKYTFNVELGMLMDIKAIFEDNESVKNYDLHIDKDQTVRLKVVLNKYSHIAAHEFFIGFIEFIAYRYVNIFKQEKKDSKMEYIYLTCSSNNCGMKMKMTIE